ncbi:hypothetical protein CYPRO_1979 [Cyclonatronum proteinivorum]|uniref:Uncharacterized protein n=1 Tax=Cyclonatronum proteinivorum TaxID=1457365 RepID=A0A345UL77_9BACT|nr:hypothetical protein [Cyclonatronum proteinivorum]AXJ01229.1 hypothetical protein CYPRO_1979 [Cyclonatronum proteinivorum]
MDYFTSFTESGLNEFIRKTKKQLLLCLPALHKQTAQALLELNQRRSSPDIRLIIDFDSETLRRGHGDFESIAMLREAGIPMQTMPKNRISFIISDDTGYYLFTESRILASGETPYLNAVAIDRINLLKMMYFFFKTVTPQELIINVKKTMEAEREMADYSHILVLMQAELKKSNPITDEKFEEVKKDIEKNPPLKPDFRRIVDFYSNKFQYVKLKFEGGNIKYKKVTIPKDALPINNSDLKNKLESKLNVFNKGVIDKYFQPLNEFQKGLSKIREVYLSKMPSRDESLLKVEDKIKFEIEIEKMKARLHHVGNELVFGLFNQVNEVKEDFSTELRAFLEENKEKILKERFKIYKNDKERMSYFINDYLQNIINKIKWPKIPELIDRMMLTVRYSDITYEDLRDEEFLNELVEKGIIDSADYHQITDMEQGLGLSDA